MYCFKRVNRVGGETQQPRVHENRFKQLVIPTISLHSLRYKLWEGIVSLTCALSAIFITYQISFDAGTPGMTGLAYLFDAIFIIHIAVKFHVSYWDQGTIVTNKARIRKRYLTREFVIDILSTLPLELLTISSANNLQNLSIAKMNRILRFYTVFGFLGKLERELGSSDSMIRTMKYSVTAFTLMHLISCGWYIFSCPNQALMTGSTSCYNDRWGYAAKMMNFTTFEKYMKCFYWATITATSTGYGDIVAVSIVEKWYAIVSMLCGVGFFFGPVLGYMASNLTNEDAKRALYTHRLESIKGHLEKKVSSVTQSRVLGFYEHVWNRHQGVLKDKIFHELPETLKHDISLVLHKHVIEIAPLFDQVSDEFMRLLSIKMKSKMYVPNQIILNENEMRSTLFYISKGSVDLISSDAPNKLHILKEGSFFGELGLLLNIPQAAAVRARTYCEVLQLDRLDLNNVCNHFPSMSGKLHMEIKSRFEKALIEVTSQKTARNEDTSIYNLHVPGAVVFSVFKQYVNEGIRKRYNQIRNLTLKPDDRFLIIWNILITVIVLVMGFIHTSAAAFNTSFGKHGYGHWSAFLYFIDFLYLLDMFFVSRTEIKDENGAFIDDPKKLRRHYFREVRFWVDLVTVFPVELPLYFIPDAHLRYVLITFLRSNRLIKLYKVISVLQRWESDIKHDVVKTRSLKLVFLVFTLGHVCACIWFIQACYGVTNQCVPGSWAARANFNNETSLSVLYITSMYWAAASMTSTGYGDIVAHTTHEEFIATVVFLIGLLLFGYCLSNITATLANKGYPKVKFAGRITGVVNFLQEHKMSKELIDEVVTYLALVWSFDKGEAIPGSKSLMGDMPNKLQYDVSYEETKDIISKIVLFKDTEENFRRHLATKFITYVFLPGNMIANRGDIGREMYIIRRGYAEVIAEDETEVLATLGPGHFFGELSLMFGQSRKADVRAKTYCEVCMLEKSTLDAVLVKFPLLKEQFRAACTNTQMLGALNSVIKDKVKNKKKPRIDFLMETTALVEQNRRKSRSLFKRKRTAYALSEEELDISDKLTDEFETPYRTLPRILHYLSHLLLRETINPSGSFIHVWTIATVAMSCLSFITMGLQFAYLTRSNGFFVFNYLLDIFFCVDIYVKFHVGYYNEDGMLVTHPTATAKHYLKSNFLLDLLAVIPLDLPFKHSSFYFVLKMNRILHFAKISTYFSYIEEPVQQKKTTYLQLFKFTMYTYLMIHYFACVWFKLACSCAQMRQNYDAAEIKSGNDTRCFCWIKSWALQKYDVSNKPTLDQYITSMYWAIATTCGVGYGDIRAYTVNEKAFASFCMVFGVVFFGYILASMTASLANAGANRARFQSKLDVVKRFLSEQNVNEELSERVKDYYELLWYHNHGVDQDNLFEGIPKTVHADITFSLYKDIIGSVPLFQDTGKSFTKMLSMYIRPFLLPKGEYICRKGDLGEEMFFIQKGIVEVVSDHATPIVFATMAPGQFFGEISIIFSCPRTASIRTQTNTDLFVLKKKDLDVVLGHYPDIRKTIIETAEERQRMVAERSRLADEKKAEEKRLKAEKVIKSMQTYKRCSGGNAAALLGGNLKTDKLTQSISQAVLHEKNKAENDVPEKIETTPTMTKRFRSITNKIVDLWYSTIHLDSHWRLWMTFNSFLVPLNFFTITYMAAFEYEPALTTINILIDISFYIEVFLNFRMAYIDESYTEVVDIKKVAKHYLRGEFIFDAIANFPLWWFAFATSNVKYYHCYFNLVQILRLKKLVDYQKRVLNTLDTNILLNRLVGNAVQTSIAIQVSAALWYTISCRTCTEDSWIKHTEARGNGTHSYFKCYTDSVYWAIATMTSTGYGDIIPARSNNKEMIFAGVVMFSGKILLGFVLSSVASTMANIEAFRVAYEEHFSLVLSHMLDKHVPKDIQKRVVDYYQYIWQRNKGLTNDGIFDNLPSCLNAELHLDILGDIMKRVPIFLGCELPFISMLCTKTRLIQLHELEYIYESGDMRKEMYFISRGKVEIKSSEGGGCILGRSDSFGEDSFMNRTNPRVTSALALTHVDLFCLNASELDNAFLSYPEEEERVRLNMEGESKKVKEIILLY